MGIAIREGITKSTPSMIAVRSSLIDTDRVNSAADSLDMGVFLYSCWAGVRNIASGYQMAQAMVQCNFHYLWDTFHSSGDTDSCQFPGLSRLISK